VASDYNILADYIVGKYIDRLSGNDLPERIIGEEPSRRVMVGMLAEDRIEATLSGDYAENVSTKYESVPSISVTIFIKNADSPKVSIKPTGLLFYSVAPQYKEVCDYILSWYSQKDRIKYSSIQNLCETHVGEKCPFPQTYMKMNISNILSDGIQIDISDKSRSVFHLEEDISAALQLKIDKIASEIKIVQNNHISLADLLDENRFNRAVAIRHESVMPRWLIDIHGIVTNLGDTLRVQLTMVNKTAINGNNRIGYIPKIFNAGIRILGLDGTQFEPIALDCFRNSFREKPEVYAVAENTSARYISESNEICTDNVPLFRQYRLITKEKYSQYIRFDALISDTIGNLKYIAEAMQVDYIEREKEYANIKQGKARKQFGEVLNQYKQEYVRFMLGINQIEYKDSVRKAFNNMNLTFNTRFNSDNKYIEGWRLFQIVFIVSMIPELIRSEYSDDTTLSSSDLETANLLYFPTGGGKTEAFLGITIFSMFFDRIRGKNEGITSFIKYPLRLLSVQQLDRILKIVMKANVVRSMNDELKDSVEFRIGFYVGSENTPNKISQNEKLSNRGTQRSDQGHILESDQDTLNEYYRFIDSCPHCGIKSVNVRFDKEAWKLEHICDNPECEAGVLPLLIVDSEIYRYLPSIVVATVDKIALLGVTNEFKQLFGIVKSYCPVHGFSSKSTCTIKECKMGSIRNSVSLKDPAPTLFIQDEMHLVKESLGTFDSHYESFVNYYVKTLMPESQRKQIRFVGATATITRYEEHLRHLYHMEPRRFPCEYPSSIQGEDFYSYTDYADTSRIMLGYIPYGRSVTDSVWESAYIMRLIVHELMSEVDKCHSELQKSGMTANKNEFIEMIYDYWLLRLQRT
jgi:hypothetical protein